MSGHFLQANISPCTELDFPIVKKLIAEFSLDDNDLDPSQFQVAKSGGKIVGFGRLRQYPPATNYVH